jgi:hypothetical protein
VAGVPRPGDVIMAAMVPITRIFADQHGHARFEDIVQR